jgi:hypothetical protein
MIASGAWRASGVVELSGGNIDMELFHDWVFG